MTNKHPLWHHVILSWNTSKPFMSEIMNYGNGVLFESLVTRNFSKQSAREFLLSRYCYCLKLRITMKISSHFIFPQLWKSFSSKSEIQILLPESINPNLWLLFLLHKSIFVNWLKYNKEHQKDSLPYIFLFPFTDRIISAF